MFKFHKDVYALLEYLVTWEYVSTLYTLQFNVHSLKVVYVPVDDCQTFEFYK